MKKLYIFITAILLSTASLPALSADETNEIEEIVVTGSQIKGAKITGALPVSIISGADIEATEGTAKSARHGTSAHHP